MQQRQVALVFNFPGFELQLEGPKEAAADAQQLTAPTPQLELWGDLDDLSSDEASEADHTETIDSEAMQAVGSPEILIVPSENDALPAEPAVSNEEGVKGKIEGKNSAARGEAMVQSPFFDSRVIEAAAGAPRDGGSTLLRRQGSPTSLPGLPVDVLLSVLRRLGSREWATLAASSRSLRQCALCDELWSEAVAGSTPGHPPTVKQGLDANKAPAHASSVGSGDRDSGALAQPVWLEGRSAGLKQGHVEGWEGGRALKQVPGQQSVLGGGGFRAVGQLTSWGARGGGLGTAAEDGSDGSRSGDVSGVRQPAFGIRLVSGADGNYPALNPAADQGLKAEGSKGWSKERFEGEGDPQRSASGGGCEREDAARGRNVGGTVDRAIADPRAQGHTAVKTPAVTPPVAPPAAPPHRYRPALLAALQRSFTAIGWLKDDLGNIDSVLRACSSCPPSTSAPVRTSTFAPALAASLIAVLDAADGRQRLLVKGMAAVVRLGRSFECLRSAHDQFRISLCSLWQDGAVTDVAVVRLQLMKLTRTSWTLAYEVLTAAFQHTADCVAWQISAILSGRAMVGDDAVAWRLLLLAWDAFRSWVGKVLGLCSLLSDCISAEQAAEIMQRGRLDTPSLIHVGRAAFRSQVMLSYGLRRRLQAALLAAAADPERAEQHSMPSMLSIRSVLEELDVQDDATQPLAMHTRRKFRRVYGLEPAANKLRLGDSLRVPTLG